MRVLVIGNGAREHALLWKLRMSRMVGELFAAPGNAGMKGIAECIAPPDPADRGGRSERAMYADLAEQNDVALTVVGPEAPLVDGIVDEFRTRGLRVFGPTASAAKLEGSKIWAKQLMGDLGIPTAAWDAFEELEPAKQYAKALESRCVIKADGLAGGKGSFVCRADEEIESALDILLTKKKYGNKPVLIEELLDGQELSVFAISDGRTVIPFGAAQDHKRAFDGDRGPNTGGMGAYSPVQHMQISKASLRGSSSQSSTAWRLGELRTREFSMPARSPRNTRRRSLNSIADSVTLRRKCFFRDWTATSVSSCSPPLREHSTSFLL
jgi:phosphoribosylamine--glycine ligase